MTGQHARYREIALVLSRHGMGYLVAVAGLDRWLPLQHGLLGHERRPQPYTQPEHLRLALEELGATFVKLGQVLSTRPDLLPRDFQEQLAKLQDSAPPVPPDAIEAAITEELGRTPREAFARFDPEPLASASIGQAHLAVLADGTDVVVKVRRPGIVEQVHVDLEILHNLAVRASRRWPAAVDYDVVGLAAEFADTVREELDYLQEGHNAERFAAEFAGDPDVHIPRVFWDTTTSRVLTLERLQGVKVSDLDALDAAGIDRPALAARATRLAADMIFEHGFFHADPHPGNLFIEAGGRIGLIDFGMVGQVSRPTQKHLAALLAGFGRQDPDRIAAALLEVSVARHRVERARLVADAAALLGRYQGRALGQIPIGPFISDVLTILRHHHLTIPHELALLLKMVVMTEGMGAHLDPRFQLGDVLGPYAQRLVARQFDPAAWARQLGGTALDALQLGVHLPGELRGALDALGADREVHLRTEELEPLVRRVEQIGNRLIAGMLTAALVRAITSLGATDPRHPHPPSRGLATASAAAAGALTGYLAWTARRRRPRPAQPPGGL